MSVAPSPLKSPTTSWCVPPLFKMYRVGAPNPPRPLPRMTNTPPSFGNKDHLPLFRTPPALPPPPSPPNTTPPPPSHKKTPLPFSPPPPHPPPPHATAHPPPPTKAPPPDPRRPLRKLQNPPRRCELARPVVQENLHPAV